MNTDDKYQPINCDLHSKYELAIMHRTRLRIVWRDTDGQDHLCTLLPLDLKTDHGEEFLIGQDHTGQTITLRLDRIMNMHPATVDH